MKRNQYRFIIPGFMMASIILFACKSFLDKPPMGAFSQGVLANKTGVQAGLVGAYHSLLGRVNWGGAPSNWVFGSVNGGDSYKGSTPSDQGDIVPLEIYAYNVNNPYLNEKWVVVYDGIARTNEVLRLMALATDLSAAEIKTMQAEARFLRGYWHLEAKRMWQNVPFVDETVSVTNSFEKVKNVDEAGNYIDIWPQIEAELQFAYDNLPETQPQVGRANKWAAAAFLAKAYMIQKKYAQAKTLLDALIANGKTAGNKKYALVNFQDNFNASTDNSAETVFAVQMSVNDGSGTNGNYGDNLNFPNSGGPGGCCGFNNPSISLANAYKTDAGGLPMPDTYNAGPNVSDPAGPYTGFLDPRIDLTMGRPGIPYLDWGPHPGPTWIRDPGTNGWFSPRKNVYAQSQNNLLSSKETSFWGPTQMDANNVNLIRFADIILWAAEVETEIGSLAQALTYVNMIRNRAADPTGWVYTGSAYNAATGKYTTQVTPAANYKISLYPAGYFTDKATARKAIMFERKLELAMEGHRFFDLQRWNTGGSMAAELNAYIAAEKPRPSIFSVNTSAVFTANKNEIYPIPQAIIDYENSRGGIHIKQNPGY
ncbi:MAG TPA: RagB/SusD family nutrient uptake outer membrane protein [Chitinophagaceae bacterium]|nr:RagB/SusD family nutrient uptake outer membrane protein [Chitinophagaceae bacterium]